MNSIGIAEGSGSANAVEQVVPAFLDYEYDARWWTGPIDKIQRRLAQVPQASKGLAVLVTTGAFCPIHQGHVQMLEHAKRELESRGVFVLGGYICPDHDQYVTSKVRSRSISAAQRLELCELATEESDWLMVDRWAAIYASGAVRYTTIVSHIDKMIKQLIKSTKKIQIVYACGGDNAMFAFSFTSRWFCVCVQRPGSLDVFESMTEFESLRQNPRIIFSLDATAPLDSTAVRKGNLSGLGPKVRERWLSMQHKRGTKSSSQNSAIYLRNEGQWCLKPFLEVSSCSTKRALEAYNRFCEMLRDVLQVALGSNVHIVQLEDQDIELHRLISKPGGVLSLDPCLNGDLNMRLWHVSKPLVQESTATLAPPEQSASTDITRQSEGQYILLTENLPLDAESERLISEYLPSGCCITERLSHLDLISRQNKVSAVAKETTNNKIFNARDFLVGSREGGSVLQLDEAQLIRAPNILPYVRPSLTLGMDTPVEVGFSQALWKLNFEFFEAIGGRLTVKDTSLGFQALCKAQEFPENMRVAEICKWHLIAFEEMEFQKI